MILFFFGEDAFRLKEKRLALKNTFFEKNPGSTGFFEFDFSDGAEVGALAECLLQRGLFVSKKFVIARGIFEAPIEMRRELAEFLDVNSAELSADENRILLLCQNGQPKKVEKLWKALSKKEIKTQEFEVLGESMLLRWLDESVKRAGASGMELSAKKALIDICREAPKRSGGKPNTNMFQLDTEVKKLATYRTKDMVREVDVHTLSPKAANEETVFQALDLLFSGKRRDAALLFSKLSEGGESLGLLGMCAWQLRNIVRTKGALTDGQIRNASDTAKLLGMHPFAAGKCFHIASQFSLSALEKSFSLLARLDREAKSGDRDPEGALLAFVMGE